MSTTAPDYLTTLRDGFAGAVQQWMDQSTTAWDQWSQAWAPSAGGHRPGDHHHEKGCGCEDSGRGRGEHKHHGDCGCRDACDCCVPEADVIVHARAGELRVVPFRLHNSWRREREVSLEVGPWHGCAGDQLQVRAVLEDEKIVLGPCEDRVVRLLISTRGAGDEGSSNTKYTKDTKDTTATKGIKEGDVSAVPVDVVVGRTRQTTDVTSCASAYADVRFEGCARPQRVTVVVLPADCDAVEVECDCGCCC